MRMFLAIELSDDVREHLIKVQKKLLPVLDGVAMTKDQNLHVTLKFLGAVDDRRVAELCESLSKVSGGPIELAAEGLECFPERGPIRIVAAKMGGSEKALGALHAAIEQRCRYLGFERENRKYRPHVTLGRARRPVSADARSRAAEESEKLWPGPTFDVPEFVLMESHLKPQGSEYRIAARFPL